MTEPPAGGSRDQAETTMDSRFMAAAPAATLAGALLPPPLDVAPDSRRLRPWA
ncbi:MAG: hypothetical protein MUC36_20625 [Planctomycetes bacterium]|jgi:hypothetical protein|nr:hypothetical protein [Planctomycetota bacterium]